MNELPPTAREVPEQLASIGHSMSPEDIAATYEIYSKLHENMRASDEVRIKPDIPYGEDDRQKLDLFLTEGDSTTCLLFVHGGGFIGGNRRLSDKSPFYGNVGRWGARAGFSTAVMSYRLAPQHRWPAGIDDVAAASNWLRREGPRHDLDMRNLVLVGHSAGASHVADYIAARASVGDLEPVSGAILISGMYQFDRLASRQTASIEAYYGEDRDLWRQRSSIEGLLKTQVPLLLATAELDPNVFPEQAEIVIDRFRLAGVELRSAVVPMHTHLSEILHLGSDDKSLESLIYEFLECGKAARGNLGEAG